MDTIQVIAEADQARMDGWKTLYEDMLIRAYVPESAQMTREDALSLAMERDREAAMQVYITQG